MTKASEVMMDETLPHGTREGYQAGCHGSHCPGTERLGMSCMQANSRFASDLSYRRRVSSGMSPEAIWADDQLEAGAGWKPAGSELPPPTIGYEASEQSAYIAPAPNLGEDVTVAEAVAEGADLSDSEFDEPDIEQLSDGIAIEKHGTRFGYQAGCRLKDRCPGVQRTGKSCTTAVSEYQRDLKARREAEAAGQVAEFIEAEAEKFSAEVDAVIASKIMASRAESDAVDDAESQPTPAVVTEPFEGPIPDLAGDLLTARADFTAVKAEAKELKRQLNITTQWSETLKSQLAEARTSIGALTVEATDLRSLAARRGEELVQAGIALDIEKAKLRDLQVTLSAKEVVRERTTTALEVGGVELASLSVDTPPRRPAEFELAIAPTAAGGVSVQLQGGAEPVHLDLLFQDGQLQRAGVTTGA